MKYLSGKLVSPAFVFYSVILEFLDKKNRQDEKNRWKVEINSEGFITVFRIRASTSLYTEFGDNFPEKDWEKVQRSFGGERWQAIPINTNAGDDRFDCLGWRYKLPVGCTPEE